MQNLLKSITEIVELCSNRPAGVNTVYGFTSLSDLSQAEFEALSGVIIPTSNNSNPSHLVRRGDVKTPVCHKTGPIPAEFDWRPRRVVTPIKNQGHCGG